MIMFLLLMYEKTTYKKKIVGEN